jgi:hypothetical protein
LDRQGLRIGENKMSCTIYYNGRLKEENDVKYAVSKIKEYSKAFDCKVEEYDNGIIIYFLKGASEPLDFNFENGEVDAFCKWNNEKNPDEFYRILDLFIKISPLFVNLEIEDDEAIWEEYSKGKLLK